MGNLRSNSTDDFPVGSRDGGVGYILIYDEPKEETKRKLASDPTETDASDYEWEEYTVTVPWKHFKSTKTEKTSLRKELEGLDDYDGVTLLGYWAGQWRTDIHQLELPRFLERMQTAEL